MNLAGEQKRIKKKLLDDVEVLERKFELNDFVESDLFQWQERQSSSLNLF